MLIGQKSSIENLLATICMTLFMHLSSDISAQEELTWGILERVTFQIVEDEISYWTIPTFSDAVKAYDDIHVTIAGYFIQMDTEENVHILSRYPYAACFFCGEAGPESIIELQMTKTVRGIHIDDRIKIQGLLRLNKDDENHFNYILENAEIVNEG